MFSKGCKSEAGVFKRQEGSLTLSQCRNTRYTGPSFPETNSRSQENFYVAFRKNILQLFCKRFEITFSSIDSITSQAMGVDLM